MASITPPGGWTHGVALPIHTLTATLADPWEHTATVEDLVSIARRAEATGHHFVGVTDHVAIPDNDYAAHMSTTWYDTVATLSYLAACTETVNLASVVWIAAYRHPLQTAKSFATLDHLSGGRAILGVGAGHVEAEFEALGVDFDARGRLLDETLEAIRGAFDDQYVSHSGEAFSYSDVGVGPAPVRELPIWVGGSGRPARRRRPSRVQCFRTQRATGRACPPACPTVERRAGPVTGPRSRDRRARRSRWPLRPLPERFRRGAG